MLAVGRFLASLARVAERAAAPGTVVTAIDGVSDCQIFRGHSRAAANTC
jgi:hypothetical protein